MPQISCPHCGQPYDIPQAQWPQYQGRTITCTKCQQSFAVTAPGQAAAPPPPAFPPAPGAAGAGAYPQAGPQFTAPPAKKKMSGGLIALIVVGVCAVLAIPFIFLLLAILLPSLSRAREQASRIKCAANLRQLSMACIMYAEAQKGYFPDKIDRLVTGPTADPTYINGALFVCPSTSATPSTAQDSQLVTDLSSPQHDSYKYVGGGLRTSTGLGGILFYEPLSNHSNNGSNFAYADGHVEYQPRTEAERLIRSLESGQNPPSP